MGQTVLLAAKVGLLSRHQTSPQPDAQKAQKPVVCASAAGSQPGSRLWYLQAASHPHHGRVHKRDKRKGFIPARLGSVGADLGAVEQP